MSEVMFENVKQEGSKLSATMTGNALHVIADKLVDCFDESGTVNYLDISFEHADTKEKYNLTMTKQSGISQGEKIAQLKAIIEEKDKMLEYARVVIQACDGIFHNVELDKYLDNLN